MHLQLILESHPWIDRPCPPSSINLSRQAPLVVLPTLGWAEVLGFYSPGFFWGFPKSPKSCFQATSLLILGDIREKSHLIFFFPNLFEKVGVGDVAATPNHTFSTFIYHVERISTSFLFIVKWYTVVWLYHLLFIHSSVGGHLYCFYFFMNNIVCKYCLWIMLL